MRALCYGRNSLYYSLAGARDGCLDSDEVLQARSAAGIAARMPKRVGARRRPATFATAAAH